MAVSYQPKGNAKVVSARHLDLDIQILDDGYFGLHIFEPESGSGTVFVPFRFAPDDHSEFDQAIGKELYDWLHLWIASTEEYNG